MTVFVLLLSVLYIVVGGLVISFFMSRGVCSPYDELTVWEVFGMVLTWPLCLTLVLVLSFAVWCVESGLVLFGGEEKQ